MNDLFEEHKWMNELMKMNSLFQIKFFYIHFSILIQEHFWKKNELRAEDVTSIMTW